MTAGGTGPTPAAMMEFTTAALVAAAVADISTGFWVTAARDVDQEAIVCAFAFSVATRF